MDDEIGTDNLKISNKSADYTEIHEIRGFIQGFNRKSIDLPTKPRTSVYEQNEGTSLDVI